jgi:hypothetical protein
MARGKPFAKGPDPRRHEFTPEERHRAFVSTAIKWQSYHEDGTPAPPKGQGARSFYTALTRWKAAKQGRA